MKRALKLLLIILPLYLIPGIYFLDKSSFLCPVQYSHDIVIRNDNRGDGLFAAKRSGWRLHNGIDLYGQIGTPVLAARSGVVVSARGNKGMGNYVIIRHPGNITTIYGHLSAIYVRLGAIVRQGQAIGAIGKTGNANYRDIMPHLHLEVRKDNIPQDPLDYIE
jgi:murein DD-endopeptidase MepM/ murein hydrolase activator NlpD